MVSVRMGELHVTATAGEELTALGLGSCIGLALIDRVGGVAGLAHVVLPESQGKTEPAAKFADLAVPELIAQVRRGGARRARLEAVLAGGARMFALGRGLDIGARNDAAVRQALSEAGVPITAAATGGSRGRTMRVVTSPVSVSVQEAGAMRYALIG
jgi:chemotaxis protein CheD